MATGTMKANIAAVSVTNNKFVVTGTISISAATDTYATNGLVLSGILGNIPTSATAPDFIEINSRTPAGTTPSGWEYQYCNGTTLDNGKVAIMNGTTEFTNAAALTAPATDAPLSFMATYPKI